VARFGKDLIYRTEKRNKKTKSSTTVPKHKLYSAILQETKKNSADFIQVQLTSMISNTETISSVNTEENPSVPHIETTSIVKTEKNFSAPNIETKSIVKTEENRSVSNIDTTSKWHNRVCVLALSYLILFSYFFSPVNIFGNKKYVHHKIRLSI
jgi:hypothetical protein